MTGTTRHTDGMQMHASSISYPEGGVLLIGASCSGKSDIALRCIDRGARLVADDRVDIAAYDGVLYASAPERIAGKLEVRGVGILTLPYVQKAALSVVVNLVERQEIERLPEASFFDCLGLQLPLLSLYAFEESATAKIRFFLQYGHALQYESE
jgi:HPr kinase/phosphorylase